MGISKLVSHNEECHPEMPHYICPVCEKVNDDETALKNHVLAIHFNPDMLSIKQEHLEMDGDDEPLSDVGDCDNEASNEGKKVGGSSGVKQRRRSIRRKSIKKASYIEEEEYEDDLGSIGAHFLDGYGK